MEIRGLHRLIRQLPFQDAPSNQHGHERRGIWRQFSVERAKGTAIHHLAGGQLDASSDAGSQLT
jgi:hypothetical protein